MAELKIGPPPFPNREKHPFVATARFRKMIVDIENLDGSTREGTDANGKPWKTKFRGAHYGEIRGSKGADGDPLDVYIKNPPDDGANMAYIVHQNYPRTHPEKPGEYDEDKVVLGVSSAEEAKELYLRHYNRKDFLRSITEMPIEPFKRYIFGENKAEKVAKAATAFIRMKMRGNSAPSGHKTPGGKSCSTGQGRGEAHRERRNPLCVPADKEEEKMGTVQDIYEIGYELGMREKLAQMGVAPAATSTALTNAASMSRPSSSKPIPGVNAPNWPRQLPKHGGPVIPVSELKAQILHRQLKPSMFKSPLTAG